MTWGGFFNYLPMFCICKLRSTAMIKYKKKAIILTLDDSNKGILQIQILSQTKLVSKPKGNL